MLNMISQHLKKLCLFVQSLDQIGEDFEKKSILKLSVFANACKYSMSQCFVIFADLSRPIKIVLVLSVNLSHAIRFFFPYLDWRSIWRSALMLYISNIYQLNLLLSMVCFSFLLIAEYQDADLCNKRVRGCHSRFPILIFYNFC